MEDDGVETDAIEEGEVRGELLYLVEHGAADLDDSELCRVGAVGGAGEDTEVALDFALSTNGVEQAGDSILSGGMGSVKRRAGVII